MAVLSVDPNRTASAAKPTPASDVPPTPINLSGLFVQVATSSLSSVGGNTCAANDARNSDVNQALGALQELKKSSTNGLLSIVDRENPSSDRS